MPTGQAYDVDPPPLLEADDPLQTAGDAYTQPVSLAEHGLAHYLHGYTAAHAPPEHDID